MAVADLSTPASTAVSPSVGAAGAAAATWYRSTLTDAPVYPELTHELDVDVAIVGGGHTGVATALELSERGTSVALLESGRIGDGATGRNGGQVTGSLSGLSAMRRQLSKRLGQDAADALIQSLRWDAQTLIRERVARYNISCGLRSGHLHTAWRPDNVDELKRDLDDAREAGLEDKVEWLDRTQVHEKLETPLYHGGALNHHNVHLNSLGLCVGEAAAAAELGAQIFESSEVLRIDEAQTGHPAVVHTRAGCVRADTVILAGNAYHRLRQPDFRGRMFPAVLGNLTTAPLERDTLDAINPDRLAVYDSRMVLDYYRITEDNRLLFGGGTNYSGRDLANVAAKLRPRLERTFPRLKGVAIEFAWTGLAGIVPNRIPLVGRLKGGLIYAQGYSGHGIATSHLVARAMADALHGNPERFDNLTALHHPRLPGGQATLTTAMLLAVGSDHAKSMIQKLKTGW